MSLNKKFCSSHSTQYWTYCSWPHLGCFFYGSADICFCVHVATTLPWCCIISSYRLCCRSHNSRYGLAHLCLETISSHYRLAITSQLETNAIFTCNFCCIEDEMCISGKLGFSFFWWGGVVVVRFCCSFNAKKRAKKENHWHRHWGEMV